MLLLVGCSSKKPEVPTIIPGAGPKLKEVPSGGFQTLGTTDIEPGKGYAAQNGDVVLVLYIGKFTDGAIFDSNMDEAYKPNVEKDPLSVTLGTGGVIKGWDQGLVGVKEGTVRKLNIPWKMAYGEAGQAPKIPAKADLMFTCKILKVYKAGAAPEIEAEDVKVGTGPKVSMESTIKFHYKGSTLGGKVFDEQKELVSPVSKLIPGFKESIIGMQAGGQRKISWPPGSPNPTGQIPAGQPVEYVVDVTEVK
jgi:FKBP-type peptidyl-prolyl cis-trans isomerase